MPAAIPVLVGILATTALSIATKAVTGLISFALSSSQKRKTRYANSRDALQRQNITSTIASIPVVYGRSRIGGVRVFADTKLAYQGNTVIQAGGQDVIVDTRGDYLYLTTVLCEGEIEQIEQILIDGIDSEDTRYGSPYRVDLSLSWDYQEPDPAQVPTYVPSLINIPSTPSILNIDTQSSAPFWGITPYATNFGNVSYEEKIRYKLYRKDLNNNIEKVILQTTGEKQSLKLYNSDYGYFEFRLVYLPDNGEEILIGQAKVRIEQDNNDFEQYINSNLTISQYSRQDGEYIRSEYRLGGQDNHTPVAFMVDQLDSYDQDRLGHGFAYLCHRFLKHNAGPKAQKTAIKRVPEISAIVKGRKIYDPRLDFSLVQRVTTTGELRITDNGDSRELDLVSVGGHSQSDSSSWQWSDNPALCILDYLHSDSYGFGIDYEYLDLDSFIATADYCDQIISRPSGNSSKRYTCNGIVDTAEPLVENLRELLSSCNGHIAWVLGRWRLNIDQPRTAVYTFDQSNIIGNVKYQISGIRHKHNSLKLKYINPAINYQLDVVDLTSAEFLAEDQGKRLEGEYELPFTTDYELATTLGDIQLKRSRLGLSINFRAMLASYQIIAGDLVELDYPPFGWAGKKFQVESINITPEGELEISAIEYDPNIFTAGSYALQSAYIDTVLQTPFDVQPPSEIIATQSFEADYHGEYHNVLSLRWTKSISPDIIAYQVEYKPIGYGEWETAGRVQETGIKINNIPPREYQFRIKAINSLGYESEYTNQNIEIVFSEEYPPDVQNFSLQSNNNDQVLLTWSELAEVKTNGFYRIKHFAETNSEDLRWEDLPTFEQIINGKLNNILLPELEGSYLIKAVNIAGLESANPAQIILTLNSNQQYELINAYQAGPGFEGQKINLDLIANRLKLSPVSGGYAKVGIYEDSDYIDLGGVYTAKLIKNLKAKAIFDDIYFDQISGFFDDPDYFFDGLLASQTTVNLLYSVTEQDPSSHSAIWSDWKNLTVNMDTFRGLRIRAEIFKATLEPQIEIEELGLQVLLQKRIEQESISVSSANQRINFQNYFHQMPTLSVSIIDLQSGDYYQVNSLDRGGFDITLYNSTGNPVSRQISYTAQGIGKKE